METVVNEIPKIGVTITWTLTSIEKVDLLQNLYC